MAIGTELTIRRATHDDYEGVKAFTENIWEDRGGDYLPRVYHDWLEDDEETGKRTFLAEIGGDVAGIVQGVMLSEEEAWFQGMRVNPEYRRMGVASTLNEASFDWARERGATVGRIMTFSWNVAALGAARSSGLDPVTEFRWARPEPDADASGPLRALEDSAAAWRYWVDSDAREHLGGTALDDEESWAVRELRRDDLDRLAEETAVFAVLDDERRDGRERVAGMTHRVRTYERENDEGEELTWAVYGVGAWDSVDAARTLFAAVSRDAADIGADRTRVLIPETVGYVSDASLAGAKLSDEPDFILGVDLTSNR